MASTLHTNPAQDSSNARGTSTETVPATARKNVVSRLQVAAILFMAAGWGWNSGNFVQPTDAGYGIIADILHPIPMLLVIAFGVSLIGAALAGGEARGARIALTVLALFGVVGCAVMVIMGQVNLDPNSVGVHTPEDWMPVVVMNIGTFAWLGSVIFRRGSTARA